MRESLLYRNLLRCQDGMLAEDKVLFGVEIKKFLNYRSLNDDRSSIID
jgi:hypothetical protein